ncbi:MAG: polysulfide reductase NrfD [Actinomycetia bacterium]|nr:polysulfide reductase NrfD [Actinomycetes bacterium]
MTATTASTPAPATARARARLTPGIGIWYLALWVFGLLGLAAWIYELKDGLATTGMRDVVSWGMYIFTFAFFIGLSAGGLIMASSAEVFGITELRPLSKLGVLSAAGCVLVAAIMILPDLGRPERIFNLLFHPNWSSPLIWDVLIILVYLIFSVVDLFVLHAQERRQTKNVQVLRVLAYIGLPLAVLLHSVTAWIFGLQIARPWWNTSLMAPLFVVSAILSGTALVTLLALAAHRWGGLALSEKTRDWLRGFIVVSLIIDLFFVGADYITILWGNQPARSALELVLPNGSYSWTFWFEWIVGGVVPALFLLVPRMRKIPGSLGIAAALVLVGVYAFRVELVVIGFINPVTQFPPGQAIGTSSTGSSPFQFVGQYTPTWVEYSIILGLIAVFLAVVTVGYRRMISPRASASSASGAPEPAADKAPAADPEPVELAMSAESGS